MASLDEGIPPADLTDERFFSAELLRLKGERLLPSHTAATELFSRAAALITRFPERPDAQDFARAKEFLK